MQFKRYRIPFLTVTLALLGSGCGDNSSFFRARNPFEAEAAAIADFKTRSELKKREREIDARAPRVAETPLPETAPTSPQNRPYFGQPDPAEVHSPFSSKKKKDESPAPDKVARTDSPVPPPPTPLSRQETVSKPRPAATGAVCYRCNGKGNHLTSLTSDGRLVTCEDCQGTGRR